MIKTIISKYIIIIVALFTTLIFISCNNELSLEEDIYEIIVGGKKEIKVLRNGERLTNDILQFASEDPEVAVCTENGYVQGMSAGKTNIFVQTLDNKETFVFEVKVIYNVFNNRSPIISSEKKSLTNYSKHDFWDYNNYTERIGDWDLLEIAKMLLTKNQDDYVFTDLYQVYSATNDLLYSITDYTNEDVSFDNSLYNKINLRKFLAKKMNVSEDKFSNYTIDKAIIKVKEAIAKAFDLYKGEIRLSNLSKSYKYRVYFSIDYKIYQTNNRYSRGTLGGLGSIIGDIFNGDIESFLNSYTYIETRYEVEVTSCFVIIEKV